MPYARNADLPKGVRDALPEAAQDVFRAAFNSALERHGEEERAFAVAWAAVRQAGWEKGEDGRWHKVTKDMQFVAKNAKRRYTLGIVYEPDTVDAQGDFAKAEDIEKACWEFMRRLQGKAGLTKAAVDLLEAIVKALETDEVARVDVSDVWDEIAKAGLNDMHVSTPLDERLGDIVECYIAPCDMTIANQQVKKGTWLMGVVWSPEMFAKIERGERIGFSMEGWARREEVN